MVLLLDLARFIEVCGQLEVDGLTVISGRWLAVAWGTGLTEACINVSVLQQASSCSFT